MTYELDKRKPGETLKDYLMRHNAHPSQPNRRKATPEEEALHDITSTVIGGGFILQSGISRRPNKPQKKIEHLKTGAK